VVCDTGTRSLTGTFSKFALSRIHTDAQGIAITLLNELVLCSDLGIVVWRNAGDVTSVSRGRGSANGKLQDARRLCLSGEIVVALPFRAHLRSVRHRSAGG